MAFSWSVPKSVQLMLIMALTVVGSENSTSHVLSLKILVPVMVSVLLLGGSLLSTDQFDTLPKRLWICLPALLFAMVILGIFNSLSAIFLAPLLMGCFLGKDHLAGKAGAWHPLLLAFAWSLWPLLGWLAVHVYRPRVLGITVSVFVSLWFLSFLDQQIASSAQPRRRSKALTISFFLVVVLCLVLTAAMGGLLSFFWVLMAAPQILVALGLLFNGSERTLAFVKAQIYLMGFLFMSVLFFDEPP